jgi:tRNA 2-(methylsulfanyl)-N6-isopentenyladenosine37 hydroxylase
VLGLLTPTDPSWVDAVAGDLDGLLRDHAHCELKAAQTALSLVGRWGGEEPSWIEPLLGLAREETEHFREVERRLAERGTRMSQPRPDDYVVALRAVARGDASDTPALLDRLLVSSLIEARSCERFKLLAERLPDAELRGFYRDLMASEARHHRLFAGLAEEKYGLEPARTRLTELAAREAAVAGKLPLGPTVHG